MGVTDIWRVAGLTTWVSAVQCAKDTAAANTLPISQHRTIRALLSQIGRHTVANPGIPKQAIVALKCEAPRLHSRITDDGQSA